jgi:D-3-phosphoglycerate dehydrogenase
MSCWKVFCNVDLSLKKDALKELEKVADVTYFPAKQGTLLDNIANFDAYFASGFVVMNKEVFDNAKNLKVIASPGTGTDHINVNEAKKRGVDVLHLANELELLQGFTATAELAWALLLSCVRKLPAAFDCAKHGNWARERFKGYQLYGKTLGIIGLGRLGTMMSRYGNGFGMNVLGCDHEEKAISDVTQVDLAELLQRSDVITIHIHLTEKNRGYMSAELIDQMKPGVVIINTSRGAIIDEKALLKNLKSGRVGGAGLDVIHGEWDENIYDHPLIKYARTHDNLVITPHIAGATIESIVGARAFMAKKLADYICEKNNNT